MGCNGQLFNVYWRSVKQLQRKPFVQCLTVQRVDLNCSIFIEIYAHMMMRWETEKDRYRNKRAWEFLQNNCLLHHCVIVRWRWGWRWFVDLFQRRSVDLFRRWSVDLFQPEAKLVWVGSLKQILGATCQPGNIQISKKKLKNNILEVKIHLSLKTFSLLV